MAGRPSPNPALLTLYDAITDSPVYRVSVVHRDEQLDVFEKWLSALSVHLKHYIDKLNKLQLDTNTLCDKFAPPVSIKDTLIGPNLTTIAFKRFAEALQTTLACQTKLVRDIHTTFIEPLQHCIKSFLKEYKDFRKQHDKSLERYETQLQKYAALRKDDPDELEKLNDARRAYVHHSSLHVMRLLGFRVQVATFIADRMANATLMHSDFEQGAQVWQDLTKTLTEWQQWLFDDRCTCTYELKRLEKIRDKLETDYLALTTTTNSAVEEAMAEGYAGRWGYLFFKTSRHTWTRRWCFLYEDVFGWCSTTKAAGEGPVVAVDGRLALSDHDVSPVVDENRRFCFRFTDRDGQEKLVCQAESEQDLQSWLTRLNKRRRSSQTDSAIATASASTMSSTTTALDRTHAPNAALDDDALKHSPTIVSYHSSATLHGLTLANTMSLSAVMVYEITTASHVSAGRLPKYFWGIPWPLSGSMLLSSAKPHTPSEDITSWPLYDDSTLTVDLPGYPATLTLENKTLRHLFVGVQPSEIVMDVFHCILRHKAEPDIVVSAPDHGEALQEVLEGPVPIPASSAGYGYVGKAFVTQDTLWIYCCIMTACVSTVALKLKDIKTINLVKDDKEGMNLILVLQSPAGTTPMDPVVLNVLAQDANAALEKLRFVVDNAKAKEPMQLRNLLHRIQSLRRSPSITIQESNIYGQKIPSAPPVEESKPKKKRLSFRNLSRPIIPVNPKSSVVLEVQPASARGSSSSSPITEEKKPKAKPVKEKKPPPPPPVDPDALPAGLKAPNKDVACQCEDHLDRLETEVNFPISARRLFELMFSDNTTSEGTVWEGKNAGCAGHDLRISNWVSVSGEQQRTLKYIMPVSNPIVRMKEAEVVETQVLIKKEDYFCYVVQISTKTAALPYADAFIPSVRYCITWTGPSQCRLSVYLGVRWTKSVMVKMIVTRAALKGMADSVYVFLPILREAADKLAREVDILRQQQRQQYAESLAEPASSDDSGEEKCASASEPETPQPSPSQTSLLAVAAPAIRSVMNKNNTDPPSPPAPSSSSSAGLTLLPIRPQTPPQRNIAAVAATYYAGHHIRTNVPADQLLKPHRPEMRRSSSKRSSSHRSQTKKKLIRSSSTASSMIPPQRRFSPFRVFLVISVLMLLYAVVWRGHAEPCPPRVVVAPLEKRIEEFKRAVFLKEVEEGLIHRIPDEANHLNSSSYNAFIQATKFTEDYIWHQPDRHHEALELGQSRLHLAKERFQLLSLFRDLNLADSRAREAEFINWLADVRGRCIQKDEENALQALCPQVQTTLSQYHA